VVDPSAVEHVELVTSAVERPVLEPVPVLWPAASPDLEPAGQVLLDLPFTEPGLVALRGAVAAHADRAGVPELVVQELVLVVHELAVNAVQHGGGSGRLRLLATPQAIRCEVSDDGPGMPDGLALPPARPPLYAMSGRGLWLAHTFAQDVRIVRRAGGGTQVTATILRSQPADLPS
jgi:anti-sigma regulatory factor (Ser/Thr protein kinase)